MPALDHGIKIIGKVVWSKAGDSQKRNSFGLAFTKVNQDDVDSLKRIIETFA